MNLHIYRNTAVEYLFKNISCTYSNYGDMNKVDDVEDILSLYFIPYANSDGEIVKFIDDYTDRINYLISMYPNKKIYVANLFNYYHHKLILKNDNINNKIMEFNNYLYKNNSINVIDISEFCNSHNDVFDPKFYYLYNAVINPKLSLEFEKFITEKINIYKKNRKKCLVVDLDNTLWGGILGEDGIGSLKISGSYPGNSFNDFQKLLKSLKEIGVILCICSKNNEQDVTKCFNEREDIGIKLDDFTIKKISWESKKESITEIAKELNISLDSIVFIDDNPVERDEIKSFLKDVVVLDFPEESYLMYKYYLNEFTKYFGLDIIVEEDLKKAEQYKYKIESEKLRETVFSEEEFIKQLKIKIELIELNNYNQDRFEQLINKTNQFNLTTKRYNLEQLKNMISNNHKIYGIKVSDKFGDLGITGISIVKLDKKCANIDSFMLSCRVLGRKIENQFLSLIINKLLDLNIEEIKAEYISSNKNEQTKYFYKDFGFKIIEETNNNIKYQMKINRKIDLNMNYEYVEE